MGDKIIIVDNENEAMHNRRELHMADYVFYVGETYRPTTSIIVNVLKSRTHTLEVLHVVVRNIAERYKYLYEVSLFCETILTNGSLNFKAYFEKEISEALFLLDFRKWTKQEDEYKRLEMEPFQYRGGR